MGEYLAELVVGDAADESGAAAEGGKAGNRVGRRPARTLDTGAHGGIERVGLPGIDQAHKALL